jgi:hypothetical protein
VNLADQPFDHGSLRARRARQRGTNVAVSERQQRCLRAHVVSPGLRSRQAGVDFASTSAQGHLQSFVSLLSDAKVPVEVISRLVGHRSTVVTETVYRKQLRPMIRVAMMFWTGSFP